MPNTYTQIHVQFVFAVKFRQALIGEKWEDELHKYITGIIQNNKHKVLAINGMPDHIHIFVGLRPDQSISELLQQIKRSSSKWINEKKFVNGKFEWQSGYGAFSYSMSQVNTVINYIRNQKEHHSKKNFLEEYREFLQKFEIEFDERYLFVEPL